MEIEVNDYVRTEFGNIGKFYRPASESSDVYYIYINKDGNKISSRYDSIVKHSNKIIDLIEVGDILKLKDGEKWEVQEHQGDGNWIQTEWEVIENEEDFKNKVDSILTHEQFSSLEYII